MVTDCGVSDEGSDTKHFSWLTKSINKSHSAAVIGIFHVAYGGMVRQRDMDCVAQSAEVMPDGLAPDQHAMSQ
ncbi:hypothetical protein E2C01_020737 [Portunus trituberculatus]|uniref:Uncharacterized protein n=1 Tax=Portunus trituberculatus TaxID=210409 RepID=A0A5B7E2C9_PORTR|nr:hypothetical protein [Portunus trituberculatus]